MVHEFGHYFAHQAYGNTEVGIVLDPFGGSYMSGVRVQSPSEMGVTSLAGPLLNIILGLVCYFTIIQKRKTNLFPLKLWGPVSMIQESVTLTLGLMTPGGDAQWITAMGVPGWLLVISGLILLCAGLFMMARLLLDAGIHREYRFAHTLGIVFTGMCSLMFIRAVFSYILSPGLLVENLIPLIFSLLLAVIVVFLFKYIVKPEKSEQGVIGELSWFDVILAIISGGGMFVSQILVYN
jgi:hypothetical protein